MRKTDKHRERQLVQQLNAVCEAALDIDLPGFRWLTHHVDYRRYPESLQVVCIVEGNETESLRWLHAAVQDALRDLGIRLPSSRCLCLSETDYHRHFH